MGTPFISLLEPSPGALDAYDRRAPVSAQPPAPQVPRVFLDAMAVRDAVFVREQGCSAEHECDADDPRSCHWVMYASVNRTTAPEERDPSTGQILQPRRSETATMPIGTLRVVPFPHPPHPQPGGRYYDNILQTSPTAEIADGAGEAPVAPPQTESDVRRQSEALPYGHDRPTSLHDGREPYVKIGRLAVIPEFRGHRISIQMWSAARKWLEDHPAYFNPSVAELGLDQLKVDTANDIPKWNGLVCAHAQKDVIKIYERWGFQVDEGMGTWYEEDIEHVGMWIRLPIKSTNPTV
ncbi:acyl-CoA N-acyltransferase [Xylariaceae sp. FL0016]|nr:acyl-CoA N-acyltransferase [Xylariaceae sp. FL0016]